MLTSRSRSGSGYGRALNNTGLVKLKIRTLRPIAKASDAIGVDREASPSKSALTGTSTASAIAAMCSRASSRVTPLSFRPRLQANPELVVASALNPSEVRNRALPTSQGFGITKQPDA